MESIVSGNTWHQAEKAQQQEQDAGWFLFRPRKQWGWEVGCGNKPQGPPPSMYFLYQGPTPQGLRNFLKQSYNGATRSNMWAYGGIKIVQLFKLPHLNIYLLNTEDGSTCYNDSYSSYIIKFRLLLECKLDFNV